METKTRKIVTILALLGVGVSIHLTLIKTSDNTFFCTLGQCGTVQNSKYSEIFGMPVAVLGLIYYITLLTLNWAKLSKLTQAWALWGLAFSSYLTIIELFVLKAICGWCVISFVIIILINLLVFREEQSDLSSSRPRRI